MATRRRYVAVEALCEGVLPRREEVFEALRQSFAKLFGIAALSRANLRLVPIRRWPYEDVFIVSCAHNYVDQVRESIAFVERVGNARCVLRAVRVSGTIEALRKRLIEAQARFEPGMRAPSQSDR